MSAFLSAGLSILLLRRLSLAVQGLHCCAGLSLLEGAGRLCGEALRLLSWRRPGSGREGSVVGLTGPFALGRGADPRPLPWQRDSSPLHQQGSFLSVGFYLVWTSELLCLPPDRPCCSLGVI